MISSSTIRAAYCGPMDRAILDRGQFGAVAPWECDHCGLVWSIPDFIEFSHASGDPATGADYCGDCGRPDCFGVHAPAPFKAIRHFAIHHRAQLAA